MEAQQIENYFTIAWLAIITLAVIIVLFHSYYKSGILKLEKESQIASFKAAIEAEEKQKIRIALNLHDQIITILSFAGQNIQAHLFVYDDEKQVPESLKKAASLIDQSISDIRDITMEMMPKTFLDFGLIKGIEFYISQLNKAEHSDIELENKTAFEKDIPIPNNDQITIYRICLEVLNNLQKHADCTYVKVTVDYINQMLVFKFEHDGKGVTNEEIETFRKSTRGLGLESLKTRLMIINAKLDYAKDVIWLSIPVQI